MSYYIVKRPFNKKRIIITCACVISVILFMSVFIFHIMQSKKHSTIALQYENQITRNLSARTNKFRKTEAVRRGTETSKITTV